MSEHDTYMTLPSLVRSAMERTAGEDGLEVLGRSGGLLLYVTPDDWVIIRDHLLKLQNAANKATSR